jgi:uncharacterized membrane protein YccC
MTYRPETPFDSIEDTHQYIELLLETIAEVRQEVDADIDLAVRNRAERREQALRLVAHNLSRLEFHIKRSRRILNDLRTLRRLLLEERAAAPAERAQGATPE